MMAGIYHHAGCCCREQEPHSLCQDALCQTDDQANPLVVVTGDCACVGSVGGPYLYAGYVPFDPQAWVWYGGWCAWENGTDFNLNIHCRADGQWRVWIGAFAGTGDLIFDGLVSADDLFCDNGRFTGTFTIPGQDRCAGMQATITF